MPVAPKHLEVGGIYWVCNGRYYRSLHAARIARSNETGPEWWSDPGAGEICQVCITSVKHSHGWVPDVGRVVLAQED